MKKNDEEIYIKCIDSTIKFNYKVRKKLYKNIIDCGGNTMFTGFPVRL